MWRLLPFPLAAAAAFAQMASDVSSRMGRPAQLPGVDLRLPLSADECAAIALSNNARLRADLAAIPGAEADAADARRIRDPLLQMLIPTGPKRFEMLWLQPLDLLLQRPKRIALAETNIRRLGESLVQNGLDVARDARVAHAGVVQADARIAAAEKSAVLRERIAALFRKRLDAGDISAAEVRVAELDSANARAQVEMFREDRTAAAERLRMILGLRGASDPILAAADELPAAAPAVDIEAGVNARPDVRAAAIEVEAARTRLAIERWRPWAPQAGLSVKGSGRDPIRVGPALAAEAPLLNRNRGGIDRANAEIERLLAAVQAARDRAESEIRQARAALDQAQANLARVREKILPLARQTADLAETAFQRGDISRLNVLEAMRPAADAELREVDAAAAVRVALAELQRSMGRRP